MKAPLTRAELDAASCDTPGCDHASHGPLFFHARCHPAAKVEASYDRALGAVLLACARCKRPIAAVAVAP
jgi:hypothetical protein